MSSETEILNSEAYEKEVDAIRANTISKKSILTYSSSNAAFLYWLLKNKPQYCTEQLLSRPHEFGTEFTENTIRGILLKEKNIVPIKFDDLPARVFLLWIVTLRKKNGEKLGNSAYSSRRAGLFSLYRNYNKTMGQKLSFELKCHFKGLKRTVAQATSNGEMRIKVGKDPMQFGFYKFINEFCIKQTTHQYFFAKCFLTLSWNLMARAHNTFSINFSHISWAEDALCIYFAHMKNDQNGENPREPRHIYANPLIPAICPILSLGLFWLTSAIDDIDLKLFPGKDQYDRFRKMLHQICETDEVPLEMRYHGIKTDDIGTHSIRKGAATYVSSGSTSGPSASAVHLRAGWKLGGVQNRYIHHQHAGDMHVGRTVSGLPVDSAKFAILPPFFYSTTEATEAVSKAIPLVFPGLPSSMRSVCKFVLASLVYHKSYICNNCPPDSPIMSSVLFSTELAQMLELHIERRLPQTGDDIQATGIPPHVRLSRQFQDVITIVKSIVPDIKEIPSKIVHEIEQLISNANVSTGSNISAIYIQKIIEDTITNSGIPSLVANFQSFANSNQNTQNILPATPNQAQVSINENNSNASWRTRQIFISPDFVFPKVSTIVAWQLWVCGNPTLHHPPYALITSTDLSKKQLKKELVEFKYLMFSIQSHVERLLLWNPMANIDEATQMYESVKHLVSLPDLTPKGRKRRKNQMRWNTHAKLLRIQNKTP